MTLPERPAVNGIKKAGNARKARAKTAEVAAEGETGLFCMLTVCSLLMRCMR